MFPSPALSLDIIIRVKEIYESIKDIGWTGPEAEKQLYEKEKELDNLFIRFKRYEQEEEQKSREQKQQGWREEGGIMSVANYDAKLWTLLREKLLLTMQRLNEVKWQQKQEIKKEVAGE